MIPSASHPVLLFVRSVVGCSRPSLVVRGRRPHSLDTVTGAGRGRATSGRRGSPGSDDMTEDRLVVVSGVLFWIALMLSALLMRGGL